VLQTGEGLMDISVNIIEKEIEFERPDIDMVIKDNQPLFSFLTDTFGEGIRPVLIDPRVRLLEQTIEAIPDRQTCTMQFIQIREDGVVFWPFISSIPHPGGVLDPMNLMFSGAADISRIEGLLTKDGLDWQIAPGTAMYALTVDVDQGDKCEWEKMGFQLRTNGVVSMMRFEHHIRVYQGTGNCCIGAVHRDVPHTHKIGEDWTRSCEYLQSCLTILQEQNQIGAISTVDFNNAGTFQGYSNDGSGMCVEVPSLA
jgi:hypothetical protein